MASPEPLHALLEQTGWIHALARRLVADSALADDLAQETWVDALEQRPDATRPMRSWLATAMRHNLAKLRRGERNRAAREQGVSRAERLPSTLDVVERASTHRDVVLAVLALEEPYRSTLLMRFFEQLSYRDIAKRTGVTRASVNSRVTRGLEHLRQRLESTYGGDRRALALALLPLAKLPTGVATTILGMNAMYLAIGTTAVTLLAVAASVDLAARDRETPERSALLATPSPEVEPRAPVQGEPELPGASARAPLAADPAAELMQQKQRTAEPADDKFWRAELFHARILPATVESLAVNTGSGNVEVKESPSGQLEITAKVRAKLGTVSNEKLTQTFEDHVDVIEEDGTLSIEDAHDDERGWTVSFVVHVPASLPVNANSGSGDVVVRRAQGSVNANTGSGDVTVALANERVAKVTANTGSGNVVVEVSAVQGKLSANTGSGDVIALVLEAGSPGSVGLNSGSGDVLLIVPPGVAGSFDLETNGDDIVLPPALGLQVQKHDGGRLSAKGSFGNGGTYKLRSGSGELEVQLGNRLPAEPR